MVLRFYYLPFKISKIMEDWLQSKVRFIVRRLIKHDNVPNKHFCPMFNIGYKKFVIAISIILTNKKQNKALSTIVLKSINS